MYGYKLNPNFCFTFQIVSLFLLNIIVNTICDSRINNLVNNSFIGKYQLGTLNLLLYLVSLFFVCGQLEISICTYFQLPSLVQMIQ
uniref:7TM_GPCR_Srx domain-containing protein n=1 Tax=Heterorhabditis bacteriophora TaxID=37862 RepID=A0A1I7WTU7_HETBA